MNQRSCHPVHVVQFSDCHLLADIHGKHLGANVYEHLARVLNDIKQLPIIDAIIFTGDLSQDHSLASYQHFKVLVEHTNLPVAVSIVAGNHDDITLIKQQLNTDAFSFETTLQIGSWQVNLVDSTTDSPDGFINISQLEKQLSATTADYQLLVHHHHSLDVGYFIDRHGLINQQQYWQCCHQFPNLKAVLCGHVHQAIDLRSEQGIAMYSCPATSVQFAKHPMNCEAAQCIPGYRLFTLTPTGEITTQIRYVSA
jgi:Icc protein